MASVDPFSGLSKKAYRRRIWAWTMYDWANSAFATTILAAVLPIYYSQVAGATLPSRAAATALWSSGLALSLFVTALLSPILGTISDVMRGKKRFLGAFFGIGVLATGLMVLIDRGDWLLASILFALGRIGFTGANVFYDALLPHVAREEDRDQVSTRGYAMGYLGGGILLAVNVAMIQFLPGTMGPRLSFLSVALWWGLFTIPLLRDVPEPPAATAELSPMENVFSVSFKRLWETLRDVRRYQELFKYLLAFLIYNDGIGTIIGVAAIYGAELGFGAIELTLALLLVQFVGIPFSLIFGRIPSGKEPRRPLYLAFVIFNVIMLPLVGVIGLRALPGEVTGARPAPFEATAGAVGEGQYDISEPAVQLVGPWDLIERSAREISGGGFFASVNRLFGESVETAIYARTPSPQAAYTLPFNGRRVQITHSTGPDHGIWAVLIDGEALRDGQGSPVVIDGYSEQPRFAIQSEVFEADRPGVHTLTVQNTGRANPSSSGILLSVARASVLPGRRQQNLLSILGLILALQVLGALFALLFGRRLFSGVADRLDTKRSVVLALVIYAVIAVWGYFLDSTVEFWFLAWLVAIVQGGSQALSRSLYAAMSPAAKSGEFFGLFGVMEKFSAILGPILFAAAGAIFASSRPAILSLIVFFVIGIWLLNSVDVDEGRRVARQEDAALLKPGAEV